MNANDLATAISALTSALSASPLDHVSRLVLADALEESGEADNLAKAKTHRKITMILRKKCNKDLPVRIAAAHEAANGNLRARTVSDQDIAVTVIRAIRKRIEGKGLPASYCGGQAVANSYGYAAACAVFLAVVRKDGKVCVDGKTVRAGGSPATAWKELKRWQEDSRLLPARLQTWAEAR